MPMTADRGRSDGPGDEAEAPKAGQTPPAHRDDGSGCLFGSLAVLALVGLSPLIFYLINGMVGPWRYVYYSITAEFEVDGEIVSASRVVECTRTPHLFGKKIDLSGGGRVYDAGQADLALPLGDGSALVIKSRQVCEAPHVLSEDDDYFPLVYWIDDVENPRFGEAYLDKSYFLRPDARVRLISVDGEVARRSPVWLGWLRENSYDIAENMPWLHPRQDDTIGGGMFGYFVVVAEQKHWEQFDPDHSFISQFSEPTYVSDVELDEAFNGHALAFPREVPTGFLQLGSRSLEGLPCLQRSLSGLRTASGRHVCEILKTRTYALEPREPAVFHLNEDVNLNPQWPLGLLASTSWMREAGDDIERPTISLDGSIPSGERRPGPAFIVDPANKRILRLQSFSMNLARQPGGN